MSLIGIILLATAALAQVPPQPDRLIESTMVSRIEREGGEATQIWSRKWRIIILFNSSNAANNSAYTDLALNTVTEFLRQRVGDPATHEVSFFPYQLDIYSQPDQSVQNAPLTPDTIQRIEQVFPRIPFRMQPDGVTPYPSRGGHDNYQARKSVADLLKESELPTLLIQLTDLAISESPGTPSDDLVRSEDRRPRGVEGLAIIPYDTAYGPIETNSPRQRLNLWLYGPATIAPPKSPQSSETPPSSQSIPTLFWAVPLGLVVLGGLVVLARKLMGGVVSRSPKWAVKLPNSGGVTIEKGELYKVVGRSSQEANDPNTIVLRDEDIPATLFALEWGPSGLKVIDHVWHVETSAAGGVEPLSQTGRLLCQDKTSGEKRFVEIEVSKIEG